MEEIYQINYGEKMEYEKLKGEKETLWFNEHKEAKTWVKWMWWMWCMLGYFIALICGGVGVYLLNSL